MQSLAYVYFLFNNNQLLVLATFTGLVWTNVVDIFYAIFFYVEIDGEVAITMMQIYS